VTFGPFLAAPFVVQLHALAAVAGFGLGLVQLARSKGDVLHRRLGWLWVGLMAATALSSFAIHDIRLWGPFSPLHLLALVTLWSLFGAIRAARQGNIRRHAIIMTTLFLLALVVAGAFTLLPGRLMHQLVFTG